jgi:hypothetical protein
VCSMYGDGKSWTIRKIRADHPAHDERRPDGSSVRRLPILTIRVSKGLQSADRLMLAMAGELGAVPSIKAYRFRQWFVEALIRAGVELIVIDDAQDLTETQLSYLRELTDQLADVVNSKNADSGDAQRVEHRQPSLVLVAACNSKDPLGQPVWAKIARLELNSQQFSRRLDGPDPIVFVDGLSKPEVGAVLASFDRLYRIRFPGLFLAEWGSSVYGWLTDPRIDRAKTETVRMRWLTELVRAALVTVDDQVNNPGPLPSGAPATLENILLEAATRLNTRGLAYTVVPATPAPPAATVA